ncbi:hypothetical protein FRC00_007686 [Tulasnella sp. 408]|nr:hypothetical protein FRC00_007686 [Tulasnella sp. 408]
MKEEGSGKPDLSNPEADSSGIINLIEPTIVFKIQNTLFGLPRSEVMKSGFFRGMLESPYLGDSKEGSIENPIVFDDITGVTPGDMKSLLRVINIRAYEDRTPSFSVTEWAAAYRLAKMWDFDLLRDYIFKHLDQSVKEPFPRIEYADLLGFENWIVPALAKLCQRTEPLTAQEGAKLGLARFAEVCKQRERGRDRSNPSDYEKWIDKAVVLKARE